jgi:hypothetical protein
MIEEAVRDVSQRPAVQQKDNLCGPFHAARVLVDFGVAMWDGVPLDQDLVALHSGTTLPAEPRGPQVPAGASSLRDYRYELPRVDPDRAGTSAGGLARAISLLSGGRLECVPLRGSWLEETLERLIDGAGRLDARLIANVRTGPLWGSRPPVEALLAHLSGRAAAGGRPAPSVPAAEWDVGHFVELVKLLRGPGGTLVLVRDSYPSLGWNADYLQPTHALAAALTRGDGREGGVLAVLSASGADSVRALARELSLQTEPWDNGTQEVED